MRVHEAEDKGWLEKLQQDRADALRALRDGQQSYYAAVARHDVDRTLGIGGAPDDDVQLEGLAPRQLSLAVEGDHFLVNGKPVGPSAKVPVGRYVLRLSHQNFPALVVLDPESPRLHEGPDRRWWPPDADFRVHARLLPDASGREEIVQSTRGHARRALRLGTLEFTLRGQPLHLAALRLLEPGVGEAEVSIFFRDATTGHGSYPVGRYVDATPLGGDAYLLDFNRAYNPACAFSEHYNCPIPPRENVLPVAVEAGEQDPH